MRLRRGTLSLALIVLASPALADAVLPIGGAFGNEAGCAFFMSGDLDNDELLLVTPDTFTTYATGCYFETLVSNEDHRYVLQASCTSEGNDSSTHETVTVTDRGREGVFVSVADVADWGPLFHCPGTEGLFAPRGVPV